MLVACTVMWSKTYSQRGRFLLLLEELDLLWDVSLVRKHHALLPAVRLGMGPGERGAPVPSHWLACPSRTPWGPTRLFTP